MKDILDKYKKQILWESPIEIYGLLLYPIKMLDAIDFYSSSGTMMIDQSEIQDEQLMKLSYMELIYSFIVAEENQQTESKIEQEKVNFKDKLFTFLSLCFQISSENIKWDVKTDTEKNKSKLVLKITQNNKTIDLTSGMFANVRKILCEQNSIEIPDLSVNPEIRKNAEKLKESSNDFDFMNLVYSIAAIGRYNLSDIAKWSLFRFNKILEAMEKEKNYTLYKGAELGGMVSFKNGNPIKTWLLTKAKKDYGIMSLEKMTGAFGMSAQQTSAAVNKTQNKTKAKK